MTDAIPADLPTPIDKVLAPDSFDVSDWLDDAEYATKTVEVFNKGELLQEVAELDSFISRQRDLAEKRKVDSKTLIGSIVDEGDEVNYDELIAESEAAIDAIIASMKGTGLVVHMRGIAPGQRQVIEDKIARSIKPKVAKYEEIDGERVLIEEAVPGGRQSPEYATKLAHELTAVSISKIVAPNGVEQLAPIPVESVTKMAEKLIIPEFNRLANAAYEVNYLSYDIDSKVTVDF